jgi:DNA-binding beta-propeller fold protein YncE
LALGDGWLFVADSESSSLRGIQLASGNTRTFVGGNDAEPRDLFAFGDRDGRGDKARLQHPLGVIWLQKQKRVLVADTYNHRLKLVDPATRTVKTFAGSGSAGRKDGKGREAEFYEPSGFALHPDGVHVFVADTNNHAIRKVNVDTAVVTTVDVRTASAAAPEEVAEPPPE